MLCKHPFMRDPHGRVFWSAKLTEEERLGKTPFPCGRCLPCKINKCRVWQARLILEQRVSSCSCFVTLTYNDLFLPHDSVNRLPVLYKPDLINYIKRVRRKVEPVKIRYYGVGEYGTISKRPHYHIVFFGIGPNDQQILTDCWSNKKTPMGYVSVGDLTVQSARYIVGYIIAKLTKEGDPRLEGKPPEFSSCSRKNGGIGYGAILQLAENLKKMPYWTSQDILNSLKIGGKTYPLGGYLTHCLADLLDTDPAALKSALYRYQDELILDHYDSLNPENYYHSLVDSGSAKVKQIEARLKIFRQHRSL